jgi:hypothetical protein
MELRMSIKPLIIIVTSICSIFAIYHFQNTSSLEGRNFRLTLSFQNTLNRVVKDSEYAIELPYGFVAQPEASVSAQTIGFGERRAQLAFGATPKYAGQVAVIEGVITNVSLPDFTTSLTSCLHPLIDEYCSKLVGKYADSAEITLLTEQSFKENEQLLLSEGLDKAKWMNLIELFHLGHLKQAEGMQIRIVRGINSTSSIYEPEIWLETKKQTESTWLPVRPAFTNGVWLATYVYPEFGGSIPSLNWISGYGLTLVNSELEIAPLPITNK